MNKTIVVFGQSRSGTTLLMDILFNLDVDVGELFKRTNMNLNGSFEELGIGNCLWRKEAKMFPAEADGIANTKDKYSYELCVSEEHSQLRSEFSERIEKRNEMYKVWAFKNPVFIHQWRVLHDLIRNPYFIVIKRNLESNAISFSSWTNYKFDESMEIINKRNNIINSFIEETTYPTLIINFEEIIEKTYETIQTIADFVEKEVTKKAEKCVKKQT